MRGNEVYGEYIDRERDTYYMEEPVIADDEMLADLFGDFKGIDFGEAEDVVMDEDSKPPFSLEVPLSEHLEHLACDQMPVYEEVGALPVDDQPPPLLMSDEGVQETLFDFADQICRQIKTKKFQVGGPLPFLFVVCPRPWGLDSKFDHLEQSVYSSRFVIFQPNVWT
jgi:hypothetical protein